MASYATMGRRSDSVRKLYDSACDLLFAAQRVRAAAGERRSAPAVAATIGCVEATLEALWQAVSAMRRSAVAELSAASDDREAAALVVERELAALADALSVAQASCDQTRERTAPVLARLLA